MANLIDAIPHLSRTEGAWPRALARRGGLARCCARSRCRPLDHAEPVGRAGGRAPCAVRRADRRDRDRQSRMPAAISLGRRKPPAGDPARACDPRPLRPRTGRPVGPAAVARFRRLGRDAAFGSESGRRAMDRAVRLPPRRGREPAPDPGRAGSCRHHRARPLPLHRQWRDRGAAGAAARLCAQGDRGADGRRHARARRKARRPHLGRRDCCLCARLRPRGRGRARHRGAAAGRAPARPDGRARAHRQPSRRFRRDLQRRVVFDPACAMRHAARIDLARRQRLLRSSADDGPRRARRRRGGSRPPKGSRRCAR